MKERLILLRVGTTLLAASKGLVSAGRSAEWHPWKDHRDGGKRGSLLLVSFYSGSSLVVSFFSDAGSRKVMATPGIRRDSNCRMMSERPSLLRFGTTFFTAFKVATPAGGSAGSPGEQ